MNIPCSREFDRSLCTIYLSEQNLSSGQIQGKSAVVRDSTQSLCLLFQAELLPTSEGIEDSKIDVGRRVIWKSLLPHLKGGNSFSICPESLK
jgi:hypothetical protein